MIDREGERIPDTGQPDSIVPVMTARQAADFLGVNERTIRRAIARGDIPARKRAGCFRIQRASRRPAKQRIRIIPKAAMQSLPNVGIGESAVN